MTQKQAPETCHDLLVELDQFLAAPGKARTAADGAHWDDLRARISRHVREGKE